MKVINAYETDWDVAARFRSAQDKIQIHTASQMFNGKVPLSIYRLPGDSRLLVEFVMDEGEASPLPASVTWEFLPEDAPEEVGEQRLGLTRAVLRKHGAAQPVFSRPLIELVLRAV